MDSKPKMKEEVRKCESCYIIEGGDVCFEILEEFRGHLICEFCRELWLKRESRLGREVSFEKMVKGQKVIIQGVKKPKSGKKSHKRLKVART